jgi:predicted thioesterase
VLLILKYLLLVGEDILVSHSRSLTVGRNVVNSIFLLRIQHRGGRYGRVKCIGGLARNGFVTRQ